MTGPRNPAAVRDPVLGQILYSVPQAAKQLSISPRLCWSFVLSGELPSRLIAKRRLIHRRALEIFASRDHALSLRGKNSS